MNKRIEDLFRLDGRVAIITGGAGMLGSEYAKTLAGAGAYVFLFDIRTPAAMKAHASMLCREIGRPAIEGFSVDVSDEKKVQRAVAAVARKKKRIDILVNNAALTDLSGKLNRFAPYEEFPLELWKRELDVGLTGAFLCARAVLPHMMRRRAGVIVNISSTYGVVGPDNRIYEKGKYRTPAYAAAKSAMLNFTRAFASYGAPHGIRVNTLTPGGVFVDHDKIFVKAYANRTMLGRMARRDEYRGAMLFLCSDASSYMTGSNLIVDGGWTAW
ncbi:SDR family oxidoreductase [Candidatus Parcubacteria bacterium]|nr:SDR family oxidoreductase [Candidatus Parcubacteria bacterium]